MRSERCTQYLLGRTRRNRFQPSDVSSASRSGSMFSSTGVALGLSTDGVQEHLDWIKDVNDTQHTTVKFPIVTDFSCKVDRLYEMIHAHESETAAVRSEFIIDPKKKIRLTVTYPMNVGRNFDEIIRVIDALQTGDAQRIATPADWVPGGKVIIPNSIKDEEAKTLFPQGWTEVRPYLRTTTL
jgi:peroxiredoxin (alkyl hydroperoxide reductase subunit C)